MSISINEPLSPEWWRAAPVSASARVSAGRLAFPALALYLVVLIAAPQEFVAPLQPLRIALQIAVIAIGAHLLDRSRGLVSAPRYPRELVIILGLLGWAVLTLPSSYWPGGSVKTISDIFIKSIALFVLLAGVVDSVPRLRAVAWVVTLSVLPVALTALNNYATGNFLESAPGRIAGYGTSGLAGNPNDLALLLSIALPLTAALVGGARSVLVKLLLLGMMCLSVAAIVATFSRSGFIALAALAVLSLWRLARRGRVAPAAIVVALAGALYVAAPAGYLDRLSTMTSIEADQTGSSQDRWRDIVTASKFVAAHPLFGAGIGMDYLALNEMRGNAWLPVHNIYLSIGADLGWLGLAAFLVLLWLVIRAAAKVEHARALARDEGDIGRFAAAIRIALITFAIAAFFYPVAYQPYFYLLGGLALAIRHIATRPDRSLSLARGRR